jgi:CBS domain-containing protein
MMLVKEIMSAPVVTVGPRTTLRDAAQLLDRHSVTALPVMDGAHLVGVVSEADVIRESVLPDPRAHELPVDLTPSTGPTCVADVMRTHALTVPPDAELGVAVDLLTSTAVTSLPVVDHGHVVEVVSRRDVIRVLARQDELVEAEIDDLVRSAGEDWTVTVDGGVVTVEGPVTEAESRLAQLLVSTVPGVVGVKIA